MSSAAKIPDKLYFKIGEVADFADVEPYVLRYWESEFKEISPIKSRSNQRLYRRKDIETVLQIKKLLYEEGFTIDGAKKQIRDHRGEKDAGIKEDFKDGKDEAASLNEAQLLFSFNEGERKTLPASSIDKEFLLEMRNALREILGFLDMVD